MTRSWGVSALVIAEVRTEEGKLYLFVAIDRASKFAFTELHEKGSRRVAASQGFIGVAVGS